VSPEFDPRRSVLLHPLPDAAGSLAPDPTPQEADVTIERYEPERVVLTTHGDRAGFVVLMDAFDPGWEASVDGARIDLTPREFDLLYFFARHPGKVFSRMDLLNAVWGYQHEGYEHTVNTHINRLRAKIETDPAEPVRILTVWGRGYKLAAPGQRDA
jgi:hypothetical protein